MKTIVPVCIPLIAYHCFCNGYVGKKLMARILLNVMLTATPKNHGNMDGQSHRN